MFAHPLPGVQVDDGKADLDDLADLPRRRIASPARRLDIDNVQQAHKPTIAAAGRGAKWLLAAAEQLAWVVMPNGQCVAPRKLTSSAWRARAAP